MKSTICKLALLAGVILTTSAWGQSVTVGSGSALPGATNVTIPVNFTAGGDVGGIQLEVTLTTGALYTNVAVDCSAQTVIVGTPLPSCSAVGNVVSIVLADLTAQPFTSGLLANITFDVAGGAAPTLDDPLVIGNMIGSDTGGSEIDPPIPGTDGTFTVSAGPVGEFGSAPTAAAGVSVSGQISTTIQSDVIIENNGGDDGSTLNYTCSVTTDADSKFSLSGDTTNVDVAKGSDATLTVACDSSAIGGPFTGEMTCDHDGGNGPSAVFPLTCSVTAGPEPAFTGIAAGLTMNAAQQGDADPMGSVTITITGDAGTTLTGTCSMLGGSDAQISLTGGGFSVAQGAAGAVVPVACDASAEGSYTGTVSCTHNGTNVASPAEFPATCEVGPPGAASYVSVPVPGSTIEMTPTEVPAGTAVPDQVLTISNGATDPSDSDLALTTCAWTGSPEITATAAPATIAPAGSAAVTFSCDSTLEGDYTGTYSCDYTTSTGGTPANASYTVNCGVRAAESMLEATPASGSTLNIAVPAFGTGSTFVNMAEVNDEGIDASIDSCTLADGANFTVVTALPVAVPAGTTVQIEIQGTDPADGNLTFADDLTCTGTDSSGPVTGNWLLNMNVQTAAIPTLSTWGLLAMILAMFSLGGITMRRKVRS